MNKKIEPLILFLFSFILYILSVFLRDNFPLGAWVEVSSIVFFIIGIISAIKNTIKRRKESKNKQLEKGDTTSKSNNKKNSQQLIIMILISILVIVGFLFFNYFNQNKEVESEVEEKQNVEGQVIDYEYSEINVGKFYDGKNWYSLSVPSGNESVCVWTYVAGNAQIPYLETTQVRTVNEKHTLSYYGDEIYFKVFCVDDFGNQYKGKFPN